MNRIAAWPRSGFFPVPAHDPREQALREDWKAHVEPELHAFFLSARQVVEADLRGFQESEGNYTLEFPAAHAESWLNALESGAPLLGGAASLGRSGALADGRRSPLSRKGTWPDFKSTSMQLFSSGSWRFWTPPDQGLGCRVKWKQPPQFSCEKCPWSETSLIVTWLTERFGTVRTVARGARRPKSEFAGMLDLFYGADIAFSFSRKGDLHTLREVSVRSVFNVSDAGNAGYLSGLVFR